MSGAPTADAGRTKPKFRDFSEMPDDVLRSFANSLAAIGRGEKLKDVRAALASARGEAQ